MELTPEQQTQRLRLQTMLAAMPAVFSPELRFNLTGWLERLQREGVDVSEGRYPTRRKRILLVLIYWSSLGIFGCPVPNDLLPDIVRRWDEQLGLIPDDLLPVCFQGALRAQEWGTPPIVQPADVFAAYFAAEETLVKVVHLLVPD